MSKEKWWEGKEYCEVIDLYRSDDTSCEIYDIPAILSAHTARIVEVLEGMKLYSDDISFQDGYNSALYEAITKIKSL